jgi:hypothetical protein
MVVTTTTGIALDVASPTDPAVDGVTLDEFATDWLDTWAA